MTKTRKTILLTAVSLLITITLLLGACASAPAYYENVKGAFPAIVRVLTATKVGSGVIVTKDGYVLTSQHVVDTNKIVTVLLNNGANFQGTVAIADEARDLAVIKLPGSQNGYTYAPMGDSRESDSLQISSPILIAGYPAENDIHNLSLSTGTLCAFPRMQSVSYLQSDAKISAGTSGGAMMDASGDIIGIINSKYTNMEGRCATFATAISEAKSLLDAAAKGQATPVQTTSPITQPSTEQKSCPEVGCLAPDFTLMTPEGKSISLSSLNGKKVLVEFASTRCSTCLEITLCIQQFYENWPRDQLEVLTIISQEKAADAASWVKLYGIKNPVVVDPNGDIYNKYRPEKVPGLYFLDKYGTIKIKKYGAIDDCATELDSLLRLY